MSATLRRAHRSDADDKLFTFELRPGICFPDWSAVTSQTARKALAAILSAFDLARRWGGYVPGEDAVRRAVIEGLAELGGPPDAAWLAARTGLDMGRVGDFVDRLASRDLIVLDKETGAVSGAYPLTTRATEHHVRVGEQTVRAMCAIDALGTAAMFQTDVAIRSRCRLCGASVQLATGGQGTWLDRVEPMTTVVWSGIRYEDGCAATSLCTVIAFFCSPDHLEAWRHANHPDAKGFCLTVDEALQVGRALFGPVLKPAKPSREHLT